MHAILFDVIRLSFPTGKLFFFHFPGNICHVLQVNTLKHFVLDFTIFIFRTLIGFWSLQGIFMHMPRCVVAVHDCWGLIVSIHLQWLCLNINSVLLILFLQCIACILWPVWTFSVCMELLATLWNVQNATEHSKISQCNALNYFFFVKNEPQVVAEVFNIFSWLLI